MNMKSITISLLLTMLATGCSNDTDRDEHTEGDSHYNHPVLEEQGHGEVQGDEHEEEDGVVKLTPVQMKTAGIEVTALQLRTVDAPLLAPGEVRLNAYHTVNITPRIAAQVVERHARLGDTVEESQPLLTLSSVEVAQAQADLQVTYREWQRVKNLGRKVVSDRRYTETQVAWKQARAKALAYGLTIKQIEALINNTKEASANGIFQLLAPQAGRILFDDFIAGERVEAGRKLMVISDESLMWVDARVAPDKVAWIRVGNSAQVVLGKQQFTARVSQIHHALDETTRTLGVRLEVNNPDDQLHPGMFVTARIQSSRQGQAITVPESAVLRSPDGDWQVLVEQGEPGEFKPMEVELESVTQGTAIISGIDAGTRVVTKGAFFVQSELAKSGFDIHNH